MEVRLCLPLPRRDLCEYLAQVSDLGGCQGRRHMFVAPLTAVVSAIFQSFRGCEAIRQWSERASGKSGDLCASR